MQKQELYLSIYIINSANVSVCMSLCASVCVSESIYLQEQSMDILQILWRDASNINRYITGQSQRWVKEQIYV